jgi:2-polyprenyl-6-methoxyphenol hydroxylase-like FAD-dependent oxidoreductase
MTDAAQLDAYYRREAGKVLERDLSTYTPEFRGPVFDVIERRASRVTDGANVVLMGDAARTAHFLTSGGVNTALVPDVTALERYVL